jgi:hypothetical protein
MADVRIHSYARQQLFARHKKKAYTVSFPPQARLAVKTGMEYFGTGRTYERFRILLSRNDLPLFVKDSY